MFEYIIDYVGQPRRSSPHRRSSLNQPITNKSNLKGINEKIDRKTYKRLNKELIEMNTKLSRISKLNNIKLYFLIIRFFSHRHKGHRHGLDVQVVAEQHRDVVPPPGVHGHSPAA